MRLHRFYTTEKLTDSMLYLEASHIHQWRNVFRYEAGQELILFGDGFEHTYKIESIDKKSAKLKKISSMPSREWPKKVVLAVALIKKDNFELLLEKCTEIGVTEFQPIITDRSLQKIYNTDRLNKILIEATEQSGWGGVPTLRPIINFKNLLETEDCVVFNMNGEKFTPKNIEGKTLCIGPEGGWSDDELELIEQKNTQTASLQTGVLRAETAAIVIVGLATL
jgi:16S rRNA (uracil1498-N3)-methyltransferase